MPVLSFSFDWDCKRKLPKCLNSLCKDNLDKLIFAHLNINSIRNKFDYLFEQIRGNVDILLVLEAKIDDSFPQGLFVIDSFCAPYRLDRNCMNIT